MPDVPATPEHAAHRASAGLKVDLLTLFWRRRSYLLWCTLLSIVVAAAYCGLVPPTYESTADVLVVQKRPQAVTGDAQYQSGFEDYLATHLAVVASPLIVERAIKASDLASLTMFADLEDPDEELVDYIIENLEVEGGSRDWGESADSIMSLAFFGGVPEECPIVVQAILDSYEAFHHEVYRGMSESTVDLIQQARDLLQNDLGTQELAYSSFRQTSPLIARGTDEINPLQDRLTSIEEQRSELLLRRAEIERQIMALHEAEKDGTDGQQLLGMVSELRQLASSENGLPNVSTALENQLIQLIDDEQRMLEHYGPDHPHVAMIRERILATRRFFALPTTAHMQDLSLGETTPTSLAQLDPVAIYKQYLDQELKRVQISETLLTDLYDREHEAAKEHSVFQLRDESLRRGIERTEELYDVVVNRLQEANLIKGFGGFETRVIAPPKLGEKVAPSRRILFPVAAFLGLLLGCGLAGIAELRDGNFHSVEQVQQQLGVPVLGQIPQLGAGQHAVRHPAAADRCAPSLYSYCQPHSYPAEAIRTLRTALQFNSQEQTPRVIHVTSPSAEDRASTIAANLAVSLAQAGKRVLLIDAALRQPALSAMFGIGAPAQGLAAIVNSDVEPEDVIVPTVIDKLWLLPTGKLPEGYTELFTSSRFGELINLFRDSYDHVLLESEPLLASADSSLIATHADGVLLVLRLTQNSRQRATRAQAMLNRIGASLLGVVVNGIPVSKRQRRQLDAHSNSASPDVRSGRFSSELTIG